MNARIRINKHRDCWGLWFDGNLVLLSLNPAGLLVIGLSLLDSFPHT